MDFQKTLLNVTLPNIPKDKFKGYRVTKQGSMYFTDEFEKIENTRGDQLLANCKT